jgi:hypothetical protein
VVRGEANKIMMKKKLSPGEKNCKREKRPGRKKNCKMGKRTRKKKVKEKNKMMLTK